MFAYVCMCLHVFIYLINTCLYMFIHIRTILNIVLVDDCLDLAGGDFLKLGFINYNKYLLLKI